MRQLNKRRAENNYLSFSRDVQSVEQQCIINKEQARGFTLSQNVMPTISSINTVQYLKIILLVTQNFRKAPSGRAELTSGDCLRETIIRIKFHTLPL